jgi:type IV secretory pathway VirB10-like protein
VSSPVSPSSPLNPVNNPPPVAAAPPPEVNPLASPPPPEPPKVESAPVKVEQPKQETKSEPKAKEDSPKDPPKAEQKNESKDSSKLDVPKGKELVHGFGIVLSLEILNRPIIHQIEITDAFKFDTEINNEFGKTQNFQLELIQLGTSQDDFNSIANSRWFGLRKYNLME